jgi:hypothetical protein
LYLEKMLSRKLLPRSAIILMKNSEMFPSHLYLPNQPH